MNWKEIKNAEFWKKIINGKDNLGTESFALLCDFAGWIDYVEDFKRADYNAYDLNNFNLRDLYDFFDENGICITIERPDKAELISTPFFVPFISDGKSLQAGFHNVPENKSRKEIEERAFESAFEILEKKLS